MTPKSEPYVTPAACYRHAPVRPEDPAQRGRDNRQTFMAERAMIARDLVKSRAKIRRVEDPIHHR